MQNPEARWPGSLADFVSSRLVRGPISKEIKVDNSLRTAAEAEVTLGSYMHGLTQAPAQIPTYTTV